MNANFREWRRWIGEAGGASLIACGEVWGWKGQNQKMNEKWTKDVSGERVPGWRASIFHF